MQSKVLEIAAAVVSRAAAGKSADAVLRSELRSQRNISPETSRTVSRMVFAYYRWLNWLESEALPKQLEKAIRLQEQFARDPSRFTDHALASKAVPPWVKEQVTVSPAWLRSLQAEPKLWLRARPGGGNELALALVY